MANMGAYRSRVGPLTAPAAFGPGLELGWEWDHEAFAPVFQEGPSTSREIKQNSRNRSSPLVRLVVNRFRFSGPWALPNLTHVFGPVNLCHAQER